ncbi:MAG TPA: C4-type zinc ribbon domain-containing protein [Candidatus Binataceae bacterium]|nr:C4-type zinc ribbon domain-containing protein [Candidatus Binataceae bacterium]
MLEEISRLASLQALDQQLRAQEQALSKITARVDELRARNQQSAIELERLRADEQQAELSRRELERALAAGEVEIRNKRMRLSQIQNERELQALGHEVESLKEGNQRLEAELLAKLEMADGRPRLISELAESLERGLAELQEAERAVAGQIEEQREAIGRRRRERERLLAQIEPSLVQRYEMLFERRGGQAVVAAKAGTCQGCRMRLPPQLFNEIQRHEVIYYCPNCQRVLYYEP